MIKLANYDHLKMLISTICWNNILKVECVDKAVNIFNINLDEMINCSTHTKQISKNYKFRKLKYWITKGLLVSIRRGEKLHIIKN